MSLAGSSQAAPAAFYPSGVMSFTYQQVPFGLNGAFASDGAVFAPAAFPAGGPGATTAMYAEAEGRAFPLVAGGVFNADRSVDAAALFLRLPAPIVPGTYSIDLVNYTAVFAFVDDATAVDLPDDITTTDFDTWVAAIQSSHKFLSAVGSITIAQIDPGTLQGMFALTATDLVTGMPVLIPDGIFSVGTTTAVESGSWGGIKALYRE